jgi:hypothetical protein
LTNVTGTQPSEQQAADIVLHYVAHAGGAVFSGMAVCGVGGCPQCPNQFGGAAQLGSGAL